MAHLLSLASFLAFLGLGAWVARTAGATRRRPVTALIACVLALQGLAGLSQRDNWPFTSHTIAVGQPSLETPICLTRLLAVDAEGREWPIDPYTWSPLYDSILQFWFEQSFPRLDAQQQRDALAFLLQRAERARERLAEGRRIGFERRLGPLASPYWLMLPRPREVSPHAYAGLRSYRVCWTPREKAGDPTRERRQLLAEYRP